MVGRHLSAALFTALFLATAAKAEEITITQKGKTFSEKEVIIKAGSTIVFENDDKATHNVYSRTKGHKFDIGAQRPGTSASHTFSETGKVKVRCAIHPRMKLTVKVE